MRITDFGGGTDSAIAVTVQVIRAAAHWAEDASCEPRRIKRAKSNGALTARTFRATPSVAPAGNAPPVCERCGFYDTGPQFVEILRSQHNDAIDHSDDDRAQVFTQILDDIDIRG